jgi:hypothetical protein
MAQGRKVSDFRGRLAGGDSNETAQRIAQKRSSIKPTGVGVGSIGGKSVVESERSASQQRVQAAKTAWMNGAPR